MDCVSRERCKNKTTGDRGGYVVFDMSVERENSRVDEVGRA